MWASAIFPDIDKVEIWSGHEDFALKKPKRKSDLPDQSLIVPRLVSHGAAADPAPAAAPSLEDLEVMLADDDAVCEGDPGFPEMPLIDQVLDQLVDLAEAQGLHMDTTENGQCDGVHPEIGIQASDWLHGGVGGEGFGGSSGSEGPAGPQAHPSSGWHIASARVSHEEFVVPGLAGVVF